MDSYVKDKLERKAKWEAEEAAALAAKLAEASAGAKGAKKDAKKPPEKKKDPKKAAAEGVVEIKGDPESLGLPSEKFYTLIDRDFRNKFELKKPKHSKVKVEMSAEEKAKN